jgi:hypothetical protein
MYSNLRTRKYNPIANLCGWVDLSKKKRKVAKPVINKSMHFADAYRKGLNGYQAAWALKKY